MKVFDVSRPIGKGEAVYPGNVPPVLKHIKNFRKNGSNLSALSLGLHTASHLDAPLHYLKNGRSVDEIMLDDCLGWCRVADFAKIKSEITARDIARIRPRAGEIILLKTKNSSDNPRRFNPKFVYLNESAARVLIKSKVKAVGIDGPSIRKFRLKPDNVHPMLLRAEITIYEGLNLKNVKAGRYYFIGLPLRIKDAEGSPVRAILIS